MKRVAIGIALMLTVAFSAFAQNDLQPLAIIKVNKSETITLKQLKSRVAYELKKYEAYGITSFTTEQKQQLLETMISERLIVQAATRDGIASSVTDTMVDQAFLNQIAQSLGVQLTEAQLSDLIKQQTGKTLQEYILANTGMTLADFKANLKNQLIIQNYVVAKKQNEIQSVAATDAEIRQFYDINKAKFVQDDMINLFLFGVPKGSDPVAARAAAVDYRNKYIANANLRTTWENSADNGTKFYAEDQLIPKNTTAQQQLGWSQENFSKLFASAVGYVSEITETATNFQFYAVLNKYDAKMLSLSDLVQPNSTYTVYEYIRSGLTQNKISEYLGTAAQSLANELDTAANVERKKTGADLTKLLEGW
ncbi:MAG: SurA N-terminal domain-containing protein [Treponema sp.]|nr:SurA N-terminal domain-containing protein [Treponema sp.]